MNLRKELYPINDRFKQYTHIAYIPYHAHKDINHPDVEFGFVSSSNDKYIFVKFSKQLSWFGWSGTLSIACDPCNLKIVPGHWPETTF